jgi:hypothetical protein
MDFKFFISIFATGLAIGGYFPYFRDVFARKTKPHLFTWLIWLITQTTATVGLLYGGGKFGSFSLIAGTIIVAVVFLLSFRYGTKDITRSDKLVLVLALLAIGIWWQLKNPYVAVLMACTIDGIGYFPTLRKSFKNPWDETILFWVLMAATDLLAIVSNAQYNFLTVAYLATLFVANLSVALVCVLRRQVVPKKA